MLTNAGEVYNAQVELESTPVSPMTLELVHNMTLEWVHNMMLHWRQRHIVNPPLDTLADVLLNSKTTGVVPLYQSTAKTCSLCTPNSERYLQ